MVKPVILLSACIEHESCRYDGSKISSKYIKKLKDYVEFITVCPEMAIGLPSPRESIRLVKRDSVGHIELLGSKSGTDYTEKMSEFSDKYLKSLDPNKVDGFILKSKSPSCGIGQVKLYKDILKAPLITGRHTGFFGGRVKELFSTYPIEHEMRLTNDEIREHFLITIFTRARFKEVKSMKELVKFHSDNKYLFMVYNQSSLNRLGNIVANHEKYPLNDVKIKYFNELLQTLNRMPNRKRNINTLTHIYGYFKKDLKAKEKAFFTDNLKKYEEGLIPISAVLSVLRSWVIRFENEYLLSQTIFEPFPIALSEFGE
ncbi:MAG: DUF523 and DUF1722 domain-containing protein [Firmicutes bacterium]|nr:DUF523 and DUF1722 domain-containing protein [Bacillota bacterium]